MDVKKLFEKKETPGKPQPVDDRTFQDQVEKSGETVLVDFWAPWCAPCRLVGGLLEELGAEYVGKVRIVKLNVDESPQTAARFGISSIPTMILFKDGKPIDRKIGAVPLNPMREWLDSNI